MTATIETARLVLASSSPRRKALLAEAGFEFDTVDPPIQEPQELAANLSPLRRAEALAYFKARSVADAQGDSWVLAADTLVAVGGEVLGKPDDADDARRMLRRLSGSRHQVITGVALLAPGGRRRIGAEVTHVTMRPISDEEVGRYIASGEWVNKAGAYAIQETADRFVVRVEGSFSNVVGLPMERVARLLAEAGLTCDGGVPRGPAGPTEEG